jgi:uncharacterized membrane protein
MASSTLSSPSTVVAASTGSAPVAGRLASLDIMRGLVMVIMAIDHTRDFFTNVPFAPETLRFTYYSLFFTRWITHFCAPLFFFLAGTGAYLYGRRRTPQALSHFLLTRGLWLIILEFTLVGFAWTFLATGGFFGVIWALGASMVLMAVIVRLPWRWIAVLSTSMIVTHDLFDRVRPQQFGSFAWLWTILHVRGGVVLPFHTPQFVLFQIVPWVGVMAAGYALGRLYEIDGSRRNPILVRLGMALTIAFILLRTTNLYGNPPVGLGGVSQGDWHLQPTVQKTVILFLDVEKYPPSLQFLLMTLGPSFLLLAWLERSSPLRWAGILVTFGRVPLFFYVLHLYVIHLLAIAVAWLCHQPVHWLFHGAFFRGTPDDYGHSLPFVYLMWIITILILYFPCRRFAALKQRRKDWWLSYL